MHPNAKWHDILQYISVGLFITVSVSQATASTTKKTAPRRPAKSNADSTAPSRRPKKRSNADSTAASGIPAKKARRNKASSTKKTKKGSNASRKRQKNNCILHSLLTFQTLCVICFEVFYIKSTTIRLNATKSV